MLLALFCIAAAIFGILFGCGVPLWIACTVPAALLFGISVFKSKWIFIWLVKCYQRFAPDHVRKRCRFEPSCSEYAIAAFLKYGALGGLKKSIGRLFRCRYPNGGYDPLL